MHQQENQQPSAQVTFTVGRNGSKLLSYALIFCFLLPVALSWNELTPCFQRQAVVVAISLVYWKFRSLIDPTYLIETFQFFVVFLFAEKLNNLESENMEYCMQTDTIVSKMIFTLYYLFFSYYIGALMALATLIIITIGYHFYHVRYVLPRLQRERCIIGEEFEQLEMIKIGDQQPDQEPQTCSICLGDFNNELVIQLPICCHLFHKECLRTWLQSHKECPNCRADIRENSKLAKENKEMEMSFEEKISGRESCHDNERRNSSSGHVSINVSGREGIRIELGSRLLDRPAERV
jgi:hypothetical protein